MPTHLCPHNGVFNDPLEVEGGLKHGVRLRHHQVLVAVSCHLSCHRGREGEREKVREREGVTGGGSIPGRLNL